MMPKCFVGPMSKNVVDACIEFSNKTGKSIGLIPSRRQVDYNSGYVNGWTTDTFSEYVKGKSKNILLERDHGGPMQGDEVDNGFNSILVDSCFLDMIHIDPFKKYNNIKDAANYTVNIINTLHSENCTFEVGTEEAIFKMSPAESRKFLQLVQQGVGSENFEKIKYFVVQFGTKLEGNRNTGEFDIDRAKEMIEVCSDFDKLSKEHNGDYLSKEDVQIRRDLGLNAINVAPEMGGIESRCIIEQIKNDDKLYNEFVSCCKSTNRWQKWFPKGHEPKTDTLLESCGHYCFSTKEFNNIVKNIDYTLVKSNTKSIIFERLGELT